MAIVIYLNDMIEHIYPVIRIKSISSSIISSITLKNGNTIPESYTIDIEYVTESFDDAENVERLGVECKNKEEMIENLTRIANDENNFERVEIHLSRDENGK